MRSSNSFLVLDVNNSAVVRMAGKGVHHVVSPSFVGRFKVNERTALLIRLSNP